jgi:hypothetical protein
MAAAGSTLSFATAGAKLYAFYSGAKYTSGDGAMAGPIPDANVANITNGFNAQKNGTVCHKPG